MSLPDSTFPDITVRDLEMTSEADGIVVRGAKLIAMRMETRFAVKMTVDRQAAVLWVGGGEYPLPPNAARALAAALVAAADEIERGRA